MDSYVIAFVVVGIPILLSVEAKTSESAEKKLKKVLTALRKQTPEVSGPERV